MKIDYLGNHSEYMETVTKWLCEEFGNEDNYKFFESIIKSSLTKDKLPLTFVAIDGDKVVGTVGLWRADLLSRQDLYPWLSALYVTEDYRDRGIGQELQKFIINYCKGKGIDKLYLYTDLENYYEKMGWEYIEDGIEYSGDSIKIYKLC